MSVRNPCSDLYFYISGYIGVLLCDRICWVSQCYILKADGGKGQYRRRWRCPRQLCLHWPTHGGVAILYLWGGTCPALTELQLPTTFVNDAFTFIDMNSFTWMMHSFLSTTQIYPLALFSGLSCSLAPSCVCRRSAAGQERSWNTTKISCSWEAMCSPWGPGYENTSGEGKGMRGTKRGSYHFGENSVWQPRHGRKERSRARCRKWKYSSSRSGEGCSVESRTAEA